MNREELILIIRNIKRSILIFFINIAGLTIAFTFVIFGVRYVYTGRSSDKFHTNKDNIYRIERTDGRCWTPNILHSWLKTNIPEISFVTRIISDGGIGRDRYISKGETSFLVGRPLMVDGDFFKIFTFPSELGDISSFESDKYSIILSKPVAEKIFGDDNPVGETVFYNNAPYIVKAVLKKVPVNSSVQFDLLIPALNIPDYANDSNWRNNTMQTFIRSDAGTGGIELQQKIRDNVAQVFKETDIEEELTKWQYTLNPLARIYFSEYSFRNEDNICIHGSKKHSFLVSSLVIIVLAIALINFINTYFARTQEKRKILAVRSISGATRTDNFRYIIIDCLIPILISVVAALIISIDFEPFVNSFLENKIVKMDFFQISGILVIGLFAGFLTGFYPAFYLTSQGTDSSLKAPGTIFQSSVYLRNFLITFQFTVTIAMIVILLIIQKQFRYISDESGRNYHPEGVVYLSLSDRSQVKSQQILAVQRALRVIPGIENVSSCLHLPGDERYSGWGITLRQEDSEEGIMVNHNCVDYDYPEVLGYEFVQGRSFNPEIVSDHGSYIVNESFIEKYAIKDLSKVVLNDNQVIGVIKDFHYNSLHSHIEPLAIQYIDNYHSRILLKLDKAGILSSSDVIKNIQAAIDEIDKKTVADIQFLENHIALLYIEEKRLTDLVLYLSFVSIVISCMGLFAMSFLLSRSRTKEIGIRKVNGAKARDIILMLNKDLIRWVLYAFPVACLISWLIMDKWMRNFEYRVKMSLWIFILAGVIAIAVAILTVSWQSWRAARRNPVEALRYE